MAPTKPVWPIRSSNEGVLDHYEGLYEGPYEGLDLGNEGPEGVREVIQDLGEVQHLKQDRLQLHAHPYYRFGPTKSFRSFFSQVRSFMQPLHKDQEVLHDPFIAESDGSGSEIGSHV